MGPIPAAAADGSAGATLLMIVCEIAGGLVYGLAFASVLRRRARTAGFPDPKGGLRVIPLPARPAPDARKVA
jgi:hypothetical protein